MSLNDEAPMFFAAGLQGISAEGPNVILSFAAPIPSQDHAARKYCTNVRVVMSSDAVKQMVEFLQTAERKPAEMPHPMPDTPQ